MATTIQQIELPKKARAVDTSGNNNHGQIYSGRGLEFDGVTDYLQVPASAETDFAEGVPYTWSTWVNFAGFDTWFLGLNQSHPNVIALTSGLLAFREAGANAAYHYLSSTKLNLNTWYRLVVTADASNNMKLYINGVLDHTLSEGDSPYSGSGTFGVGGSNLGTDFQILRIGSGYSNNAYGMEGMMSNFQVWDAAFTQTDVTYDYLNPESLALNASGSALTESNLKLWYPMQDGHRGQQSYILDGANTGLGVEISPQLNFDTDEISSWAGYSDTFAFDTDHYVLSRESSDARRRRVISPVPTVGVTYKVSVTAKKVSGSGTTVKMGLTNSADSQASLTNFSPTSEFQTYTTYVTATSTTTHAVLWVGSPNTVIHYKNLSIKAINDKHHATTVFYGDELGPQGTFVDGDLTGWDLKSSASNTTDGTSDYADITTTASSNNAIETTSSFTTVVGRTYRVFFDRISGTQLMACYINDSASTISAYSLTAGSYTLDFVATSTAHKIGFRGAGINHRIKLDNVSIKEIGVASGWTDADQQLHIPQTALQSYNELLHGFSTETSGRAYVSIADDAALDVGTGDFSLSLWFKTDDDYSNYTALWRKGGWGAEGYSVAFTSSNKLALNTATTGNNDWGNTETVIEKGKWHHVVGVWDRSGSQTLYLNGVEQTMVGSYDISGNTGSLDNSSAATIHDVSNGFAGCITEVALFKTIVLSDAEVLELYNDGKALDVTTHSQYSTVTGYWRNNGLSTWNDLSTNSNNGTVTGTETILIPQGVDSTRDAQGFIMNKEKSTSCLNLTDQIGHGGAYVDSPTGGFVGTSDFSISCWFKTTDSNAWLLSKGEQGGGGKRYQLYIHSSNYLTAEIDDNSTFVTWNGSATVNDGDWHHAVVAYDRSGNGQIYLDGSTDGSATDISSSTGSLDPTNHRDFTVGINSNDETSTPYTGQIDGVLIYTKALSLTEVEKNYNATKGNHRN